MQKHRRPIQFVVGLADHEQKGGGIMTISQLFESYIASVRLAEATIDAKRQSKNQFRLIQSFKLEKKTPETYSETEIRRMLTVCECPYMRTIILLGFYCALRVGEALNLQLQDIDWDRKEIHIRNPLLQIYAMGAEGGHKPNRPKREA